MTHLSKKLFQGRLCDPLHPDEIYEVFWEKHFSEEGVTIALRPLSFPGDEALLRQLAMLELPERPAMAEVLFKTKKDELIMLAASDFGQSFLGTVNDRAAFIAIVHRMQQHVLGHFYSALPGDHKMSVERLPVIEERSTDAYASAVWQSCTDCFLSFPEVGRLVSALDIFHPSEKQYCRAAGFRPLARKGGSDLEELYFRSAGPLPVYPSLSHSG